MPFPFAIGLLGVLTSIGNFIGKLPPTLNYILFTALIGMDAFIIGGTTTQIFGQEYTITGFVMYPLNTLLGWNLGAFHVFIILVLLGCILMVIKFMSITPRPNR